MDWNVGPGVATLAAYSDGTVSLYQSAGGGIIGAGQHEAVRAAGLRFVALLRSLAPRLEPAGEYPLPSSGQVVFWLVCRDRTTASGSATVAELAATVHPFHNVMGAAQATLTALREHPGMRSRP
jgi:hypothetical protein